MYTYVYIIYTLCIHYICIHYIFTFSLSKYFIYPVASYSNPEACVYDKIFSNYNKNIRPVRHPDDKVELDMKFVFRNLGGIVSISSLLLLQCVYIHSASHTPLGKDTF